MSLAKFLAFDFGAESGRAILGVLDGEKIVLEEIHRFPNRQLKESGHIHWGVSYSYFNTSVVLVSAALAACKLTVSHAIIKVRSPASRNTPIPISVR